MFRKLIFYLVLLTAMFLGSGCGGPTPTPTPTPIPMTLVAPLEPYNKPPDMCSTETVQAGGKITYQSSMTGGFSGMLQLSGLNPNQWYIFTVNGWQGQPGNDQLMEACPQSSGGSTGYCDYSVRTNAQGEVNEQITLPLPRGQYVVKYLVKDKSQDYCIMLYNDAPPRFEVR